MMIIIIHNAINTVNQMYGISIIMQNTNINSNNGYIIIYQSYIPYIRPYIYTLYIYIYKPVYQRLLYI